MSFDMNRGPGFEFGGSGAGFGKGGDLFGAGSEPDPTEGIEYTGRLGEDIGREFEAVQEGYRARAKRERARRVQATDSEYWFAVCFRDRDSKDKFLKALKAPMLGDKYIDGHQLARMLGIDID